MSSKSGTVALVKVAAYRAPYLPTFRHGSTPFGVIICNDMWYLRGWDGYTNPAVTEAFLRLWGGRISSRYA